MDLGQVTVVGRNGIWYQFTEAGPNKSKLIISYNDLRMDIIGFDAIHSLIDCIDLTRTLIGYKGK